MSRAGSRSYTIRIFGERNGHFGSKTWSNSNVKVKTSLPNIEGNPVVGCHLYITLIFKCVREEGFDKSGKISSEAKNV